MREKFFLSLIIGVWLLITGSLSSIRFFSFDLKLFDHGIYYYIVSHLSNYGSWMDYAGDFSHRLHMHFSVILLLFVPFAKLSASPLIILFLQLIVCASGAVGIYLIAKYYYPEKKFVFFRLFFPVIYLCYFPLLKAVLYDFDVSRMAPAFIIFFIYFAVMQKKHLPAIVFAVFLCCTRETLPLLVAGTGLYLFFFGGSRKSGFLYFAGGIAAFLIITFWIMPSFQICTSGESGALVYFSDRYSYFQGNSLFEKGIFGLTHPLVVMKYFFAIPYFKWINFFALSLFLLFIPLLEYRFYIIPVFVIVIYYLSGTASHFEFKSQYFSEIYPVIFIAFIPAFKRFYAFFRNKAPAVIALSILFLCIISAGGLSSNIHYIVSRYFESKKYSDQLEYFLKDTAKINAMKNDSVAVFVHNRLFLRMKWKRYMTGFIDFRHRFDAYKKIKTVKKIYIISINEPAFGNWDRDYKLILNEAKKDGFKKVSSYKNYEMYEYVVR